MPDEFVSLAVHEEFAKRIEDEEHRQNRRIEILEGAQEETHKLVVSVEKMALSMESMTRELERQGQRLDRIEEEPADKWRRAVWIVLSAIIGCAITYVLKSIGL